MNDDIDNDAIENAAEVIKRFGGIRPMATKMEVPVTTVQGWKKRNVIPANRREEVLEAADENNIDLGDLIESAANENGNDESQNFGDVIQDEMDKPDEERENEHVHEESVLAAQRTAAAELGKDDDDKNTETEVILGKIRTAEQRALQKSVLVSVVLIALTAALMAFLFIPGEKTETVDDPRIQTLETEVAEVKEQQSLFGRLVPENFREEFESVKQQAQSAKETVEVIRAEAGAIKEELSDPNLSINERLTRLEQRVDTLGAPEQVGDLIEKVKVLQGSVQGQEQLAQSFADLSALVQGQQGQIEDIDAALAEAQTEDDALGQTLQGLSKEDLKAGAMLLTLTQFRNAVNRDEPFAQDLATMQKMLKTDQNPEMQDAINRLAPHAEDGVMSPARLKTEFKGLAGDVVMASLKGEDVSVREKAMARFNEVLSVEKDGELITGTDTQATVARAQKLLDEGNIQGAIAELETLDGGAKDTAQPWIEEAQATLMAGRLEEMFTGVVAGEVSKTGMASGAGGKMNVDQLIRQIKSMTPQGKVVTDEASGFRILERQPLELPDAP